MIAPGAKRPRIRQTAGVIEHRCRFWLFIDDIPLTCGEEWHVGMSFRTGDQNSAITSKNASDAVWGDGLICERPPDAATHTPSVTFIYEPTPKCSGRRPEHWRILGIIAERISSHDGRLSHTVGVGVSRGGDPHMGGADAVSGPKETC